MDTDKELLEQIQSGHTAQFAVLVERHQRVLLRVVYRYLKDYEATEDVVQETFIKAFKKLNTFEGRSSLKSWLVQIALNTARNRRRSDPLPMESVDDIAIGVSGNTIEGLENRALGEILRGEIDRLPEKQKEALQLRIYEDLSFKEIAEIMGCPYDTAKANYRHALLKIRARLGADQGVQMFRSRGGGSGSGSGEYDSLQTMRWEVEA